MSDRDRWDTLAAEKSPLRAAWDEDHDGTAVCLSQILPWLPHDGNFLDLGCGPGRLTVPIAKLRSLAYIYGVDVSPAMIRDAKEPRNVCYLIGNGVDLPELPPLDAAWSVLLFQHLEQTTVYGYFHRVAEKLVPGGVFIFQFPTFGGDRFQMTYEMVEGWAARRNVEVVSHSPGEVWTWMVVKK